MFYWVFSFFLLFSPYYAANVQRVSSPRGGAVAPATRSRTYRKPRLQTKPEAGGTVTTPQDDCCGPGIPPPPTGRG